MSILIDGKSRVLVQGLGKDGSFQAKRMMDYGTNVVAAVHPSREGSKFEGTVPYFESVADAVEATGADIGLIFVPAPAAPDAIIEQADAGLPLIVCISEGIPVQDTAMLKAYLSGGKSRLLGPNCPGLITPKWNAKAGIIPHEIVQPGKVGVVSRSGTLTYEAIYQLTEIGLGQTTCVGIGGDPIKGLQFTDVLRMFQDDDETEAIMFIGEIGGKEEQLAAAFIRDEVSKPVAAFVAGKSAPKGKRMGHAGAVVSGRDGLASEKEHCLAEAGAFIAETPGTIGETVLRAIRGS